MTEWELDAFLRADSTTIFLPTLDGERVGLLEAVRHAGAQIEITNFGIVPSASKLIPPEATSLHTPPG